MFQKILDNFAHHFQLGPNKRVVLALDQATFHTTKRLKIPDGIGFLFFPPKSPELQPAESLWPLTSDAIANRTFENLDDLEKATIHRYQLLLKRRQLIRGATNFHWWEEAVA